MNYTKWVYIATDQGAHGSIILAYTGFSFGWGTSWSLYTYRNSNTRFILLQSLKKTSSSLDVSSWILYRSLLKVSYPIKHEWNKNYVNGQRRGYHQLSVEVTHATWKLLGHVLKCANTGDCHDGDGKNRSHMIVGSRKSSGIRVQNHFITYVTQIMDRDSLWRGAVIEQQIM